MIHNSCTTGVEAYILDEPVICYCPVTSEIYDSELPNTISSKAFSVKELIALVRNVLEDTSAYVHREHGNAQANAILEDYVKSVRGPTACENIISALTNLINGNPSLKDQMSVSPVEKLQRKMDAYAISAKRILRRILKGRAGGSAYLRQKFPGLSLEEIQQVIDLFKQKADRFGSVKAQTFPGTKTCFLISQDRK